VRGATRRRLRRGAGAEVTGGTGCQTRSDHLGAVGSQTAPRMSRVALRSAREAKSDEQRQVIVRVGSPVGRQTLCGRGWRPFRSTANQEGRRGKRICPSVSRKKRCPLTRPGCGLKKKKKKSCILGWSIDLLGTGLLCCVPSRSQEPLAQTVYSTCGFDDHPMI